ncbi:MAG: Cu(I)/Ag(I) efflux system membrane fusion protein [Candidatus Marinamargulisbacteria bacterium]|jgi:Cu(I)/Ag(I) efflux system membrane fusion protein
MNKKILMLAVVIAGMGAGLLWSCQNNKGHSMTHSDHQMSAEMEHSNHDAHREMKLSKWDKEMMRKMDLPDPLRKQLDETILAYFDMQKALSKDSLVEAKKRSTEMVSLLMKDGKNELSGAVKTMWEKENQTLIRNFKAIGHTSSLSDAREAFEKLSLSIEMMVAHFGGPEGQQIAKYHCPMVDHNRGASWLQNSKGTQNPYYGSQMFSCGKKIKEF